MLERGGFLAIAVVAAAVGSSVVSAPVPAVKLHSALQIKSGLWEFSDSATIAGDTVFPDAMLAGVPAGQRAERLAELRRMMSQPTRERECVSQAVFEQRLFSIGSGCRQTIGENTPGRLELLSECQSATGDFRQNSTSRVVASTSTAVTASMHAVSAQAGRTMTVDRIQNGHWISSSCGSVHGIQQLR